VSRKGRKLGNARVGWFFHNLTLLQETEVQVKSVGYGGRGVGKTASGPRESTRANGHCFLERRDPLGECGFASDFVFPAT